MNLGFGPAPGGARNGLPASLAVNPRLATWIAFAPDGCIEIRSGKVEIGQGIRTALAQIAAEELCVSLARIRMVTPSTAVSPNEAVTSGSLSIQESGTAIRQVCAEVRERLLARAAVRLGVSPGDLAAENGCVRHPPSGRVLTYAELDPGSLLDGEASGRATPKPVAAHAIVGTSAPRLDLADKVAGRAAYVHDLLLPGMLHGRVVRPPMPGAALAEVDADLPRRRGLDATVVRDGSFLGVVAEREFVAVRAAELLHQTARWTPADIPFAHGRVADWLRAQPAETTVIGRDGDPEAVADARASGGANEGPNASASAGADAIALRFTRPFLAHASIGPSCAVAQWSDAGLEVWTHSQGIFNLRADLAIALRRPSEGIVVTHVEGAGCYGHNGADDVALDAALLARAVPGRPVKVVWSRQDELTRAPFGPAMCVEIAAALDAEGRIAAWRHEVWSNGHSLRPGRADTPTLLAAAEIADGFAPRVAVNASLAGGGGAERNAVPIYAIPNRRVTGHRVLAMPVRTSALRSLGAFANVFAIESTIDELAVRAGADPLEFRLRQLDDARARAVLQTAAERADWAGRAGLGESRGRGIAVAHYKGTGAYCAVVADVDLSRDLRVERLAVAVDVGLVINPDGVRNQIEGGAIQATSWAVREQVRFADGAAATRDWESYPILRFSEAPRVEVHIVASPEHPPVGAGEAAHGPVVAAIANAVKHALGVRVCELPLDRERIVAAM